MSNIKSLFIIIESKHRSSFSSQNQTLHRRIHNVDYYPYVPGLVNVFKACLIVKMIFLPMTSIYTNTFLTWNIWSGDIYNLQFTPIKWHNNITRIMKNDTFNACVESSNIVVTYFGVLFITIQTFFQLSGISTYIHTISHRYINHLSYHIVWVSHCRVNVRTEISRRIHPMCTMWYTFTITNKMCVQ